MEDPFVVNFLKNYKPKDLEKELKSYTKCKKLKNYKILKNKEKLVIRETYIRYINIAESFKNTDYNSHIKPGGILLKGGIIIDFKFTSTTDPNEWTHLMLKYEPVKKDIDHMGKEILIKLDPLTYIINISKCYVFYNNFKQTQRDKFIVILKKK